MRHVGGYMDEWALLTKRVQRRAHTRHSTYPGSPELYDHPLQPPAGASGARSAVIHLSPSKARRVSNVP